MSKPNELVETKITEGINWKTGEPKILLNQKSTPTSQPKNPDYILKAQFHEILRKLSVNSTTHLK